MTAALRKALQGDVRQSELENMSNKELEVLSRMLGIPYSGTKAVRVDRICGSWRMREVLSLYSRPEQLVDEFYGDELRRMCKTAGCSIGSGQKRSMAAALLNWRERCRGKGQRFLKEMRAASTTAAETRESS